MKLLLDQNLSWRLAGQLQDLFPGSTHVRLLGLDRASDEAVWLHAQLHSFAILSKDSDFEQRSLLLGHPPKCIWLRIGNASTHEIEALVRAHSKIIGAFLDSDGESYLILP